MNEVRPEGMEMDGERNEDEYSEGDNKSVRTTRCRTTIGDGHDVGDV